MTMLLKTINGARRWRPGAVALTLAAFIPSAIPATASAGTVPPSPFGQYTSSPPGNVFVNNVKAVARTSGHPVFKVKFQFRVGAPGTIRAVNRAQALTTCNGCDAMAIGFQVVTTTSHDLAALHLLNVGTADSSACAPDCNAVADAYQVVVATDTQYPLTLGWFVNRRQMSNLSRIRSEFLALPRSGLTISQAQSKCEDLVDQVSAILESSSYRMADNASFTRPSSSARHGVDAAGGPTPRREPIVKVYRDIR
jgi:hypothetical protein